MELKSLFKNYINDIIFPHNDCLICSSAITNFSNQSISSLEGSRSDRQMIKRIHGLANICSNCKKSFELPSENHCKVCHKPLSNSTDASAKISVEASINSDTNVNVKNEVCTDCKSNQANFLYYNRSALLYNDFAKELISLYKYKGKESLLPLFTNLLAITYDKYFLNEKIDFITYVPIHSNRLEVRGFNQAERLADGLHKYVNKPLVNTLIKVKDTKKQSKQHKWDRLCEVKDSFTLASIDGITTQPEEKNILIIDDIYTTGFTLNECASVLKQAGANKVFGLTLTRAFANNE